MYINSHLIYIKKSVTFRLLVLMILEMPLVTTTTLISPLTPTSSPKFEMCSFSNILSHSKALQQSQYYLTMGAPGGLTSRLYLP